MAEIDLIDAFSDCLDRLAAGQTIEDCLSVYPQFATRLRLMLEMGIVVRRAEVPLEEVIQAQDRVRFRFTQAVATPGPRRLPIRRFVEIAAALALVLFLASGTVGVVAQGSIPGDSLYVFKRLGESIITGVSGSSPGVIAQFEQRRLEEINALFAQSRSEVVDFRGEVESLDGEDWQVEGIFVRVMAGTPGSQSASLGDRVEITGVTTPEGFVLATRVTLLEDAPEPPVQEPTPTITPTETVTPTVTVTASLTPTSTMTLTATATPTPSLTNTPRPTVSSTPTPSECAATRPEGWVEYRVQAGDTLSGIAAASGTTLEEIMTVNCLENARLIRVGQLLFVPRTPVGSEPTTAPGSGSGGSGGSQPPPGNNNDNDDDGGSSGDDGNNNQDDDDSGDGDDNQDNGDDDGDDDD